MGTQTEVDAGQSAAEDGLVVAVHLSVAVDVLILDVARLHGSELLAR